MIDPVKRLFKVNKSSEQFTTGSSDFLLNQRREDKDVVRAAPVLPESRLDLRNNIMIISPPRESSGKNGSEQFSYTIH